MWQLHPFTVGQNQSKEQSNQVLFHSFIFEKLIINHQEKAIVHSVRIKKSLLSLVYQQGTDTAGIQDTAGVQDTAAIQGIAEIQDTAAIQGTAGIQETAGIQNTDKSVNQGTAGIQDTDDKDLKVESVHQASKGLEQGQSTESQESLTDHSSATAFPTDSTSFVTLQKEKKRKMDFESQDNTSNSGKRQRMNRKETRIQSQGHETIVSRGVLGDEIPINSPVKLQNGKVQGKVNDNEYNSTLTSCARSKKSQSISIYLFFLIKKAKLTQHRKSLRWV